MKLLKPLFLAASLSMVSCAMKPHRITPPPSSEPMKTTAKAPTQAEMEKAFREYSMPGMEHEKLKVLVGKWKYTSKMWMAPNSQPEVSEGTSDNKLILGGRFLEETVKGKAMGMPFEGRAIVGFDRVTKEFNTVWIDSMMTGMLISKGPFDATNNAIKEEGSVSCPIEKGPKWMRSVLTLSDPKHPKFETFMKDHVGNEFKTMEINYRK